MGTQSLSPKRLLTHWSPSKLQCLLDCPRKFDLQYIRHASVPQAANKVFGSAVHYMFRQFFKVNYKSTDSFIGAGMGFWGGIAKHGHGPNGFSSPPVEIAWGERDPGIYYGLLRRILKMFWEDNHELRVHPPEVEVNINFTALDLRLHGVIDRLQSRPDGTAIWDYKPWLPNEHTLDHHPQLLFYDLWHRLARGGPPAAVGIYSYMRAERPNTIFRPAYDQARFIWLLTALFEAAEYVRCTAFGDALDPRAALGLQHFSARDLLTGSMSTHNLVGSGCSLCEYPAACQAIEQGTTPSTRDFVRAVCGVEKILPLFPAMELPDRVQAYLKEQLAHAAASSPKREPTMLPLRPLPPKINPTPHPTRHGNCTVCGYALSPQKSCGKCGARHDAVGQYLAAETLEFLSRRKRRTNEAPTPVSR